MGANRSETNSFVNIIEISLLNRRIVSIAYQLRMVKII
jgi:hypothetical protein